MPSTIPNGYSACLGVCDTGWYGGAFVMDGRDKEFVAVPDNLSYEQRAAYARRWFALTGNPRREIRLVQPAGNSMKSHCIAAAERLEGPVAPRERVHTPTLAWIERRAGQWHLVLFENNAVHTILSRRTIMRCPQVAKTTGGLFFTFESDNGPQTMQVELVDRDGMTRYRVEGREPRLCAAGSGFVLAWEQSSANEVALQLAYFLEEPETPTHTQLLRQGDYLLNSDMAWSEKDQAIFLAAESSPAWGDSCQIGLHREIHTWKWQPGQDADALCPSPVERRGFQTIGAENMTPIKPFVLIEDGKPVIGFKQHRYTGFRAFGWDLFWCRRSRDGWTEPGRISEKTTTSDGDFGLVYVDGCYVGLLPTHENEGGAGSKQSEKHRIDLVSFDSGHCLDRFEVPASDRADYRVPPSCSRVAPEPPALHSGYPGRQLVWGDLHIHSAYSKCVAAVDGSPRENIRFAREVLGCRVFAITEHTPHTTGIESTWLYDRLESTAGTDNVILYATEPGTRGTRDMNMYSRDRGSFEKLERILIAQDKRYQEVLRQLREDLPHDSIFVMRHVHGNAIPDEQIPQHFDPHFEVAMEAMQGRGNAMLETVEKSSIFPNSFLDAGCKIGLVGGTDHFREWAPNHFCLTGFWVKEVSADGVWEAIRNRYTFAMSDSRVALATTCKDVPMGGTVTLDADEPLRVTVEAGCGHDIRRLTLMRDGELLEWTNVTGKRVATELVDEDVSSGKHWYVVTLEVETGHGKGNTGICHSSPYFVWKDVPK